MVGFTRQPLLIAQASKTGAEEGKQETSEDCGGDRREREEEVETMMPRSLLYRWVKSSGM